MSKLGVSLLSLRRPWERWLGPNSTLILLLLLLSALTPALVAPAPALNVTTAADPPALLVATAAALIVALAASALALLVPATPYHFCPSAGRKFFAVSTRSVLI